jgi:hypothetical protein
MILYRLLRKIDGPLDIGSAPHWQLKLWAGLYGLDYWEFMRREYVIANGITLPKEMKITLSLTKWTWVPRIYIPRMKHYHWLSAVGLGVTKLDVTWGCVNLRLWW